jgi:hypothetical protein
MGPSQPFQGLHHLADKVVDLGPEGFDDVLSAGEARGSPWAGKLV